MKMIIDQFKGVQLCISGSSSFSLFNELNEPLTGRKWAYEIFPISWEEFEDYKGYLIAEKQQEIDYVEEIGTSLKAFEFKWNPKKKTKVSKTFTTQYNSEGIVISRNNFRDFVKI